MTGGLQLRSLTLSAAADLIRRRSISPLELVEATLAAIEQQNPILNCFITITATQALDRARLLTEAIASDQYLGPMHGIPVSLKDNISTAGITTTAGSPLHATSIPNRDATSWKNLADRGAVLVGKNNLWELAFGGPHPQYGPTWNPWGTALTCAGTSSGSASAVAAGLSFASLGSDTGGSARVPAALCGLVSLKPTFGRVPNDGVLPVSYSMDHVCPITRTVEDSALVLSALSPSRNASPRSRKFRLDGSKLAVMRLSNADVVFDDVAAAYDRAVATLRQSGATLREVQLPDFDIVGTAARVIMDSEAADYHRADLRDRPGSFGAIALDRLNAAEFIPAAAYVRAQRARRRITDEIEAILETSQAIVLPAVGVTAFPVEDDGFTIKGQAGSPLKILGRFTPLANLTGHPALVVPIELTSAGLPTSVQFIGRFMDDEGLLQVAHAFEHAIGGPLHDAVVRSSDLA